MYSYEVEIKEHENIKAVKFELNDSYVYSLSLITHKKNDVEKFQKKLTGLVNILESNNKRANFYWSASQEEIFKVSGNLQDFIILIEEYSLLPEKVISQIKNDEEAMGVLECSNEYRMPKNVKFNYFLNPKKINIELNDFIESIETTKHLLNLLENEDKKEAFETLKKAFPELSSREETKSKFSFFNKKSK